MKPFLLEIGDFRLPAYGVFYLIAFLVSISGSAWLASRRGVPFGRVFDAAFQIAIAGEVGARLVFVIVEWDRFVTGAISLEQFLVAGRVVFGGVLAGFAYAVFIFRRKRLPLWITLDSTFTAVCLGMAIGRIACLFAGCCFGEPTDAWWGITFRDPAAAALNGTPLDVPLHPTQILLFLGGLVIFGVLLLVHRRRAFGGLASGLFLVLNGGLRFAVEFLRGDPRGATAGLATSQWIGLGMIVVGLAILAWRSRVAGPWAPQGTTGPASA